MHFVPARRGLLAGASLLSLVLAACGDSRINSLSAGITRDSALKVINEGTNGDSLARVYKQEVYLFNGQPMNVLFYNKKGVKQVEDSTLAAKEQTPIVTIAGKVTGWGWAHYDSVAKANNIPLTPHQ